MKPLSIRKIMCCILIIGSYNSFSQTIGTFSSVAPGGQSQTLVLPATHTFQRLIKTGDALTLGGTLGSNLDFTGYVPTSGSSTLGKLSISSESTPAEIAILDIAFDPDTDLWTISSSGKVSFPAAEIGTVARFCSGTVTPNNTIMVSEEDVTTGDVNSDGYTDRGWIIEVDPVTRTVINQDGVGNRDKLWAIGRTNRENVLILPNNQVLYTGADDPSLGYLYKFVATTPGNFSSGTLYVLETTSSLGNGRWKILANTTQSDRNNTRTLSTAAGAYNFNGIEDVEYGPDGKIYFTAKGQGKVYRFTDNGTFGTATDVSGLEVFVGNSNHPTITSYDVDGAGPLGTESWGTGNDNLAFDGEGNLWVLQDGGNNHIWVVRPTHTQASPQVRLFGKTPAGSEPTGITFTPNYRYMFISFQHPNANTTSQTDAAGNSVIFNTHTTVVVSRLENLGVFSTLPVRFSGFSARQDELDVKVEWSVTDIQNHDYFVVERSVDGTNFEGVHRVEENINGGGERSFSFLDVNVPNVATVYYRIRQCDENGRCRYTDIKPVRLSRNNSIRSIYPQPATEKITVDYNSFTNGNASVIVRDVSGKMIINLAKPVTKGLQQIEVDTRKMPAGVYLLTITDGNEHQVTEKFVKGGK